MNTLETEVVKERKIFKNAIVFLLLFIVLYSPKLAEGTRDYVGIIVIISVFILLVFKDKFIIRHRIISYFFYYVLTISLIDLSLLLFASNSTWLSPINNLLYNFIPLISFLLGAMFIIRGVQLKVIDYAVYILGLFQILIGILQFHSVKIRDITIELYASLNKYSRVFDSDLDRVLGSFGNPNFYGIFIAWFALLILFYFYPKYKQGFLLIISIPLIFYALYLTDSRTGLVITLLGVLVFITLLKNRKLTIFMYLLIILFVLFLYSLDISIYEGSRYDSANMESIGGRSYIWEQVINQIITLDFQVIIGFGREYTANYVPEPHNYYLMELAQHGLIGFFMYIIFLILMFIYSIRVRNYYTKMFLLITLFSLSMGDMVSEVSTQPRMYVFFYFLVGFFLISDNLEKSDQKTTKSI